MHGDSVKARLQVKPSDRSKQIPDEYIPVIEAMIRDAYLEGYDLRHAYAGKEYGDDAPVVDGKIDHETLREDAWEGSDAKQELDELEAYRKQNPEK
jgi:hypothetical protein